VSTARNLKLAPTTKRPRPDLLADLVRIRRGLLVAVDRAATAVAYVHDVEVLAGVAKDIDVVDVGYGGRGTVHGHEQAAANSD